MDFFFFFNKITLLMVLLLNVVFLLSALFFIKSCTFETVSVLSFVNQMNSSSKVYRMLSGNSGGNLVEISVSLLEDCTK